MTTFIEHCVFIKFQTRPWSSCSDTSWSQSDPMTLIEPFLKSLCSHLPVWSPLQSSHRRSTFHWVCVHKGAWSSFVVRPVRWTPWVSQAPQRFLTQGVIWKEHSWWYKYIEITLNIIELLCIKVTLTPFGVVMVSSSSSSSSSPSEPVSDLSPADGAPASLGGGGTLFPREEPLSFMSSSGWVSCLFTFASSSPTLANVCFNKSTISVFSLGSGGGGEDLLCKDPSSSLILSSKAWCFACSFAIWTAATCLRGIYDIYDIYI